MKKGNQEIKKSKWVAIKIEGKKNSLLIKARLEIN